MASEENGAGKDFYQKDAENAVVIDEGVRIGELIDRAVESETSLAVSRYGRIIGVFVPVNLEKIVSETETPPRDKVGAVNLLLKRMAETPRR